MEQRQTISILGLAGNPDTLLARAAQLWEHRINVWADEYDVPYRAPFPPCPIERPSFDEVIAHLEDCGFRCVDVAGPADHPKVLWHFHMKLQRGERAEPVSGETWVVKLQSNLRFNGFATVKLDGADVKEFCFDMMRSGLWHLAMLERL